VKVSYRTLGTCLLASALLAGPALAQPQAPTVAEPAVPSVAVPVTSAPVTSAAPLVPAVPPAPLSATPPAPANTTPVTVAPIGPAPSVGPLPAAQPTLPPSGKPGRVLTEDEMGGNAITWDANVDLALGTPIGSQSQVSGFVRGRVGLMVVRGSKFIMFGGGYEWSNLSYATLNLQAEFMHLSSGFWGQIGALLDLEKVRPGLSVSVGYSILGVELQQRSYQGFGAATAVFGKLRIPLGVIGYAFGFLQPSH
jgi:hypothetical protein